MRTFGYICLALGLSSSSVLSAVCKKCEEVRAHNQAHPENNYEYYEDYLEAQKKKDNTQK